MAKKPVSLHNPYQAAFLAWLCPGLGHFYQGRTGKGWLYLICILGLYATGMMLGEGRIVYWRWVHPFHNPDRFHLYYLGQFFVGLPSLPALIQGTLSYFDMRPILWGFMADPPQNAINGLHPRFGKLVEVGTIYTTVAGLLNVLAIYDAYEGPAYSEADEEPGLDADGPAKASDAHPGLANLNVEGPACP